MGLAKEREHVAAGELLDRLAVAELHHPLEVAAHLQHSFGFAAAHHRALNRGEATVAEHAHDEVVEHVGLGLDRSASVVLAHQRDDPVGDLSEQPAARERVERRIGACADRLTRVRSPPALRCFAYLLCCSLVLPMFASRARGASLGDLKPSGTSLALRTASPRFVISRESP